MTPMREARGSKPRRRDARHWLPTLLVLALLASGLAAYRFEWGQRYLPWLAADPVTEPQAVLPPAGLDLPAWSPVTDDEEPAPSRPIRVRRVAASVQGALGDPDLGRHVVGAVTSLEPGAEVWNLGAADDTYLPASTTKLFTMAAALSALGPDHRFTTRVVRGATPREVVLVGGGDPLLASRPVDVPDATSSSPGDVGESATYPERADVATLAVEVADSLGGSGRVRVRFDDSLFTGPTDNPAWRRDYVPDDIVSPITALMVDSGLEPAGEGRSDDPSRAAATAFSDALGAAGMRVVGQPRRTTAEPGAEQLGEVSGAPLSEVAERILDVSDNEGAEVVAHQVGLATSGEGSFAAGAAGVVETLAGLGVDTSADRILDGSGLSRRNRVGTASVLSLLQVASGPDGADLRPTVTGLPVAGFTGSLTYRFADGPARARGLVRAKTGTLTGVHALAGIAVDRDGSPLAFVLAADRVDPARSLDAREALDRAAASLAACRCTTPG